MPLAVLIDSTHGVAPSRGPVLLQPNETETMSKPIQQELDTAFVNLPALIRYLCKRGFEGRIHIGMSGYEADITLTGCDEIEVNEKDLLTGRCSEGEDALQRLLIRSREAGGTITIHSKQSAMVSTESVFSGLRPEPQIPIVQARASAIVENLPMNMQAPAPVNVPNPPAEEPVRPVFSELVSHLNQSVPATQSVAAPAQEWQDLIHLTEELLSTIDRSLAMSNLDFQAAFAKASSEVTNDYLFLRMVSYSNGRLHVGERTEPHLFVSGVMDVLRRVMHRLGANPRFNDLHRSTVERLVDLIHRNKDRYDVHRVTTPLYRAIGMHR